MKLFKFTEGYATPKEEQGLVHIITNMGWEDAEMRANISVIHLDQEEQNTITFPIFVLGCQASVAWPMAIHKIRLLQETYCAQRKSLKLDTQTSWQTGNKQGC